MNLHIWEPSKFKEIFKASDTNPKKIVEALDKTIIGNEKAKKELALLVVNRSFRLLQHYAGVDSPHKLSKKNLLLLGHSGSGKTALIKALAKHLGLPIPIYDLTPITSAGYHGGDLVDCLANYVDRYQEFASDTLKNIGDSGNVLANFITTSHVKILTEFGIIFFDEFDKIRFSGTNNTSGRDINGGAIQQELLQYFDGGQVTVGTTKNKSNAGPLNTENISIIGGGAFVKLKDIIEDRLQKAQNIGVGFTQQLRQKHELNDLLKNTTTKDLEEFGFMPELLGRITSWSELDSINEDTILKILTESDTSVYLQYIELFKQLGIEFTINPKGLKKIAKNAMKFGLGARALKTMIEKVVAPYMFEINDVIDQETKLELTEKDVKDIIA